MKIFKTLSVSLLLAGALVSSTVYGKVNPVSVNYSETPAKTAVIKHPAAANVNNYFSGAALIHFEVYKIGSQADIDKLISTFKDDTSVQNCTAGVVTGDYQAFDLSLKAPKNKSWFVAKLKKAGINNIKINNNAIVEVDKL